MWSKIIYAKSTSKYERSEISTLGLVSVACCLPMAAQRCSLSVSLHWILPILHIFGCTFGLAPATPSSLEFACLSIEPFLFKLLVVPVAVPHSNGACSHSWTCTAVFSRHVTCLCGSLSAHVGHSILTRGSLTYTACRNRPATGHWLADWSNDSKRTLCMYINIHMCYNRFQINSQVCNVTCTVACA